jgi:hypothetical protein
MDFFGRWVPREVGAELLLLGLVGVAICFAIMYWLGRKRPRDDPRQRARSTRSRRRRGHRKT